MPGDEKRVYLTFDDGPHPEITGFVLDQLKAHDALASFFCIGKNVENHPDTYQRILSEGHSVGNHTFNHLNGWLTDDDIYVENVAKANQLIQSNLFRPPYGRLKKSQFRKIKENQPDIKVVMWSVLTGDFDRSVNAKKCLDTIKEKTTSGSIIVFHDSEKAFDRLSECLPEALKFLKQEGYECSTLMS